MPIRVSYATGKTPPGQSHTGARVPVAAIGPQASNVMGIRDQTDLFQTCSLMIINEAVSLASR